MVPPGNTARSASIGVGVGLDRHQLVHTNGARFAHATEIVALEVDEHDVLCALLRVFHQRRHLGDVIARTAAPGARSGDGTSIYPASLDAYQALW
jgi:hypothetical protein